MKGNKFAAIVLRNTRQGSRSVDYFCVVDALLSGGVLLDEIAVLSYENPDAVYGALKRLSESYDGVFMICDRVLIKVAKEVVSNVSGQQIDELLDTENCLYAVLPTGEKGAEIALQTLVPAVDKRRGERFSRVVLRTISAPSEVLIEAVAAAQAAADGSLFIHTSGKYGSERIEVVYNQTTPKMITDEVVRILASKLQEYLYAVEDVEIAERLKDVLLLHRKKLATAESFTGGGIGRAIVKIPGASEVFYEGLNTYDNLSKIRRLGVSELTLKEHGAVSSETAYEMAAGLLAEGKCDVVIATTGIAGPSSDNTQKPVGLCYIAVGTEDRVRVFEYHLNGSREEITKTAINLALFLAYKEVNE